MRWCCYGAVACFKCFKCDCFRCFKCDRFKFFKCDSFKCFKCDRNPTLLKEFWKRLWSLWINMVFHIVISKNTILCTTSLPPNLFWPRSGFWPFRGRSSFIFKCKKLSILLNSDWIKVHLEGFLPYNDCQEQHTRLTVACSRGWSSM